MRFPTSEALKATYIAPVVPIRVLDVAAGNLDLEANAILGQLLHDGLHGII